MGEIAGRLCDIAIVTSDNPRTEEPAKIIAQILEGVRKTSGAEYNASDKEKLSGQKDKRTYVVEPDRRKAIQFAADISGADDIMLIAGKGHETAQLIGSKIISFDDREEAEKAFLSRGN
jgi:UDP-N-acetylmuramyl tripeptide synthase